ncbi:hypothetical protein ACFL6X_04360 [Candidatus Latescibacterota bacterium]
MSPTPIECDPRELCRRINERSPVGGLFEGDRTNVHPDSNLPWRISPEPFWLTPEQRQFLEDLGPMLLQFQRAANLLYHQSVKGLQPAWVHEYLDAGKPERVIDLGRLNRIKSHLPLVIRPDLVLTADGMRVTELDSVPGGIGFTGQISQIYAELGYDLVGGADGLVDGFYEAIAASVREEEPVVAILVSDESEDYREEMVWLAETLHQRGRPVYCRHPKELRLDDDGILVETAEGCHTRVHVVYRFFELFDLANIPKAELIAYFAKKNQLRITPPPKAYLEEKMTLSLFRHSQLTEFWQRELGRQTAETLAGLIPRSWILDPAPAPPYAVIPGLQHQSRDISSWEQLAHFSKKERELVLKPSGFAKAATESRGVTIGHDVPEEVWSEAVHRALDEFGHQPHVLQEFHKAARLPVRYYDFERDEMKTMHGRVLVRPYYYVVGDEARLAGVQAIACPADKKVLHGMTDGVLIPCAERSTDPAA